MSQARHHHYVPQFYLRNFAKNDQIRVFNREQNKLFFTNPRNVAGERDLYRLEGPQPLLAEEMFGKIEGVLTPIISKIIETESLPASDSDEFVSLLYLISTMVTRHPNQFEKIENAIRHSMTIAVDLYAQNTKAPRTLYDGTVVTPENLKEAAKALEEGRIRIHVPRDQSLSTSLKATDTVTKLLIQRNWTLAVAEEGSTYITCSHPVLLCWDQLNLHDRHPPGFGLEPTTVYFPISPKLMMIGKFSEVTKKCILDARAVAALNGLHGMFSPEFLFALDDLSAIQMGAFGTRSFGELVEVFKEMDLGSNPE